MTDAQFCGRRLPARRRSRPALPRSAGRGARRSTAVATRKALRDHAAVRHAWFNGDMYIKGRVEGAQIPRQLRLNSGYACPAIGWTRVCPVSYTHLTLPTILRV